MTKARKPKRINACAKGKQGEREAIAFLRGLGFSTSERRIQPRGGRMDGPDFFILRLQTGSLGGYSIESNAVAVEVKRDATVRPWTQPMVDALRQAAVGAGDMPTMVMFRRNREPWGACMYIGVRGQRFLACCYGDEIGRMVRAFVPECAPADNNTGATE